jgi:hypothetical protein
VTETFVAVYSDTLLTVPDMPGGRCDICHFTEFDHEALVRLDRLVGGVELPDDAQRPGTRPQPYDAEPNNGKPAHRAKH